MNTAENNSIEPASSSGNSFSYHTVLLALRCWWRIAIPISLLLACGGAGGVYLLHKPKYTADAWLLIREKREPILGDVRSDSKAFIQNQMEFIRSPFLLGPLTANPKVVATPELVRELDVTQALAQKLSIKQRGKSDVFVVSFTSESPDKSHLIVQEVVDAYLDFHDKEESKQDSRIVELLEKQREERKKEMDRLRADLRRMSIQLIDVDPSRSMAREQDLNRPANPLTDLQSEIVAHQVEQDVLAAKIQVEEAWQDENKYEPSEKEIERHLVAQPSYLQQQGLVEALEKKDSDYQRAGRNLEANPVYKQLQQELAVAKADLEKLRASLATDIKEAMVKSVAAEQDAKLRQMKQEFSTNQIRLGVLSAKFSDGLKAAKQHTGETLDVEFLRAKLQQETAVHDAISNRILAIVTELRAPQRVQVYQDAKRPLRPDEVIPFKKMGMAASIAFMFPLGLCVLWEHFHRRVSSRSQVEQSRAMIVIGEVTSLPTRGRNSAVGRKMAERELLLFEESVDSLRTYLSLVKSLEGCQVLAVTSAVSGEGKTSLAAQLAVSIARATRERTLLIDGDMRSPDLHEVFDLDLGPGLAEVLSGECPVEEAIETSISDTLHVFTAGRLRTNPHRLIGNGEFGDLVDQLRTSYKHIIIDTPPVLPASESLLMAATADASLLCMRRDYSRLDQAQEAHRRMENAGVRTAGAVLNGIPIRQYAYQYGSYAYNRAIPAEA
jgi:polysaccharide biosynthesis transport protein